MDGQAGEEDPGGQADTKDGERSPAAPTKWSARVPASHPDDNVLRSIASLAGTASPPIRHVLGSRTG